MAALFSLTGPFSILFLPLVAPRLLGVVKGARAVRSQTPSPQSSRRAHCSSSVSLSASPRISAAVAQSGPLPLQELMTVVSMHTFFNALFGINGFTRFYRTLPPLAYGLGLIALGISAFCRGAGPGQTAPDPVLSRRVVHSALVRLPAERPAALAPPPGRPAVLPVLLRLHPFRHPASGVRRAVVRRVGYVLLAAAVGVGIPADFFHPGQPNARWADNTAVFRSLPAGSDFFVPVVPLYHGGLTLHKTSTRRGESPLSRLQPVGSPTPADFSVSRPARIVSGRGGERQISQSCRVGERGPWPGGCRRGLRNHRRQVVSRCVRVAGGHRRRRTLVRRLRLFPADPDQRDRSRFAPGVHRRSHPRRRRLFSAAAAPHVQPCAILSLAGPCTKTWCSEIQLGEGVAAASGPRSRRGRVAFLGIDSLDWGRFKSPTSAGSF